MSQMPDKPHRIDVQHHILPSAYIAIAGKERIGAPAPGGCPQWRLEQSLAIMERNGVATAVLSISAPGIWFGDIEATRGLARECNEFAARIVKDHPNRFGMFASLPLPAVDHSLAEIAYAFDVLGADGIVLMSNFDDRYLGDALFSPIFDELNRRNAVVMIHPTLPTDGLRRQPEIPELNPSALEFPFDTTRTVTSLLYSGTLARCSNIRFIIPHAGGTIPFLIQRITALSLRNREIAKRVPEGVVHYLQRLFYDIASSANIYTFASLLQLVSPSHILFGSDYPFGPETRMADTIVKLGAYGFDATELHEIERNNAVRLFPRLASS